MPGRPPACSVVAYDVRSILDSDNTDSLGPTAHTGPTDVLSDHGYDSLRRTFETSSRRVALFAQGEEGPLALGALRALMRSFAPAMRRFGSYYIAQSACRRHLYLWDRLNFDTVDVRGGSTPLVVSYIDGIGSSRVQPPRSVLSDYETATGGCVSHSPESFQAWYDVECEHHAMFTYFADPQPYRSAARTLRPGAKPLFTSHPIVAIDAGAGYGWSVGDHRAPKNTSTRIDAVVKNWGLVNSATLDDDRIALTSNGQHVRW